MNHRRQNRGRQIQIVREFCRNLQDETQRIVCFQLCNRVPDHEICKLLKMRQERLDLVKLQIAIGLKQAGIRLSEED